jgi:hypothetical protein
MPSSKRSRAAQAAREDRTVGTGGQLPFRYANASSAHQVTRSAVTVKRLIAGLVASSMLIATPAAFAGGGYDRGWHRGHGWNGGHSYYYPRYKYYGHRHHNNNNDDDWVWALGGLLVGGIVAHGISQATHPRPVAVTTSTVYGQPYPPASGRRLLRDMEGRCYEVSTDSAGYELRTELPPSACNW